MLPDREKQTITTADVGTLDAGPKFAFSASGEIDAPDQKSAYRKLSAHFASLADGENPSLPGASVSVSPAGQQPVAGLPSPDEPTP